MNWKTVMGEILTYDGTTDCIEVLQTQDLYIQDGHLREMVSLDDCIDYGTIEIGDRIFLYSGQTYILKDVNKKQSDTTQIPDSPNICKSCGKETDGRITINKKGICRDCFYKFHLDERIGFAYDELFEKKMN